MLIKRLTRASHELDFRSFDRVWSPLGEAFLQVRQHGLAIDMLINFEARIDTGDLVLQRLVSAHVHAGWHEAVLVRLVLEVLLDLVQNLVDFPRFVLLEGLIDDLSLRSGAVMNGGLTRRPLVLHFERSVLGE